MFNNNFEYKDKGYSNAPSTREVSRHRWYYYKEGFSKDLVEKGIQSYDLNKDSIIIDPFNGSGTVTLTAAENGISSYGFEVNPFTSFVSKAKTLNANIHKLNIELNNVVNGIEKGANSKLENFSTFTENKVNTEKWLFNKEVLQAFEGGLNKVLDKRTNVSKLIKLLLLNSAMENCNAKKDGKCVRYKKDWELIGYDKSSFLNSFIENAEKVKNDITTNISIRPHIISGDVRKKLSVLDSNYDFCITSPPYLNTFDYTDIYRPELFMGQFVNSYEELYSLRLKTVRSHVQAKWSLSKKDDFGLLFGKTISEIEKNKDGIRHKQIIPMIYAYFEDMENVLTKLSIKAKKNAHLWIIVSTSAYANVHLPVDLILADIATQNGWKLKEVGVLRDIIKRKSKYSPDIGKLRESLIILEKK
ncbi:MAG: hypothetical protein Mars2KO_44160 [Maribacter sp.]